MSLVFDEISLEYWEGHKERGSSSKSYTCYHEGYVYGDDMAFEKIEYVYRKDDVEEMHPGINGGAKSAYFDFVQTACNSSEKTLNNFLTSSAEKFRVYSEAQVSQFSAKKRSSTRIKDQSCKILVCGKPYYVANNLKICEFFNSAANNLDSDEKKHWFIRIYFEDDATHRMQDREEAEEVDSQKQIYKITVTSPASAKSDAHNNNTNAGSKTTIKIDFNNLNQIKKRIGDLGEMIVLDYEYKRLEALGRTDLAKKIEHTSKEKGDSCGYDIASFEEDGSSLFIEVKTTKQNKAADFYLSRNECQVGNQAIAEGKKYQVYRIYNLNPVTGTGNLTIYMPPFDEEHYNMRPENWRIQLKDE